MTAARRALITGITGQDGSYLAELLLDKGYEVHGVVRRASTFNTGRISHLYHDPHEAGTRLFLHYGDLTDGTSLSNLVLSLEPDEIYNLGAQSHVRVSFDQPMYTVDADAMGTLRLLEAARQLQPRHPVRIYQASSSEMYGLVRETPQSETTPFYPRSPYACAKVFSFYQTVTTARPTGCTPRTESCSITNRRAEARRSSRARSRKPRPGFAKGCKTSCTLAISTPSATGGLPKTMWKQCG